ncbi:MAG: hypothetical protein HYY84_20700 [Deltaproteobacteria bacterium]|nr:hypothetical protein [Deltaproteobacteria bacterium]
MVVDVGVAIVDSLDVSVVHDGSHPQFGDVDDDGNADGDSNLVRTCG